MPKAYPVAEKSQYKSSGYRQMQLKDTIQQPSELPFLSAICWDLADVRALDLDEILNRYERGWEYKGVLADLGGEELLFLKQLATTKGSWLQVNV